METFKKVDKQKVIPVLRDDVYAEVELVQACYAEITDKRQTSKILQELNTAYPSPKDSCLKRVKSDDSGRTQVLITVGGPDSSGPIDLEQIRSHLLPLAGVGELFITSVPRGKPLTRKQYNISAQHWPTHFYENKRLEALLNGNVFSDPEMDMFEGFMREALACAQHTTSQEPCVGAVIVDPATNAVVAKATNCPTHLLKHAVMVCIDNVASGQGGGVWGGGGSHSEQGGGGSSSDLHSDQATLLPQKRGRCGQQQYLCSGYDLFTTVEPCVMCAMALVHSRIGRVFYGCSDERDGALGSCYKVHTLQGLNHHFEVYRGVLEPECRQLYHQHRDPL